MLEHAKEKYAHEKIVYEHLDIDGDVTGFLRKHGTFQRVYSFKTLHWSRDLHRSLGNIAQLLAPCGECLLFFLGRNFLFESFKEISRLQPWSKYADVLLQAVPKSHDIVDQKGQRDYLSSALSSAGLLPYTSEVLMWTSPGDAKTNVAWIANPIFSLLSEAEKTSFQEMVSTHQSEWDDSYCKTGGPMLWSSFLVHARKP
ncbi:hypothetical protein MTO96_016059 [Rhipicephalus appendiculatus]